MRKLVQMVCFVALLTARVGTDDVDAKVRCGNAAQVVCRIQIKLPPPPKK